MSAISKATTASLAAKNFIRKARVEAPFGADSEAISLEGKALLNSAKLASNSRATTLSAQIALPREAKPRGETVSASPPAKKIASKAKSKVEPKIFLAHQG